MSVQARIANTLRRLTADEVATLRAELTVTRDGERVALPADPDAAARVIEVWCRDGSRELTDAQDLRVNVLYHAATQAAQTHAEIVARGEARWGKRMLTPDQVSVLNNWHYSVLNAPVEASALELDGLAPASALSVLGY